MELEYIEYIELAVDLVFLSRAVNYPNLTAKLRHQETLGLDGLTIEERIVQKRHVPRPNTFGQIE